MRAVIIGGSIAGLTSAIAFSRAGLDVLVLEADDSSPSESLGPDLSWAARRGVPQHTQAHAFLSLFIKTFNDLAPEVITDLVRLGAIWRAPEELIPSGARERAKELKDGFSDMAVINARRPFVESILRRHALNEPGIELRKAQVVRGLTSRTMNGRPHITGVITDSGESISADVVLDASGRRSSINDWIANEGGRAPKFLTEPANQLYFTRYYRLLRSEDLPPLNNGFLTVHPFPWFAALMFPGDNGTLQVAIGGLPEDVQMKHVRHNDAFHRVARMAPAVADWVDPELSEPISDVSAMGNLNNHLRRMVVEGHPVAAGIHLVGDSAMITNPQYGRGVSHAAGHAAFVARTVLDHPDDPVKQALVVDEEIERMLVPSFESSIRMDRIRTAAWREFLGLKNPEPTSGVTVRELPVDAMKAMTVGMTDPVVWQAVTRGSLLLDPPGSWVADPELLERIATQQIPSDLAQPPQGPDRQTILAALSGSN